QRNIDEAESPTRAFLRDIKQWPSTLEGDKDSRHSQYVSLSPSFLSLFFLLFRFLVFNCDDDWLLHFTSDLLTDSYTPSEKLLRTKVSNSAT
ncbi:hypothetical protein ADUPG1_003729, partial [Aduncisulcus paluster]